MTTVELVLLLIVAAMTAAIVAAVTLVVSEAGRVLFEIIADTRARTKGKRRG